MRYYTHILTSFAGVTALAPHLHLHISVPLVSGVLIGSVLPDIDESRSYIGKRIPFLSRPVNLLFGHRGLTHSALACTFFCWLYGLYLSAWFYHRVIFRLSLSCGRRFILKGGGSFVFTAD